MHESLVSGDDCTEVRKKKRKEKEGKEKKHEEAKQRTREKETARQKRMAKDGSGSVGARSGLVGGGTI